MLVLKTTSPSVSPENYPARRPSNTSPVSKIKYPCFIFFPLYTSTVCNPPEYPVGCCLLGKSLFFQKLGIQQVSWENRGRIIPVECFGIPITAMFTDIEAGKFLLLGDPEALHDCFHAQQQEEGYYECIA